MNLVLYGIDRELLQRLALRLPASAVLHWQDSTQPTSAQDLQRGANSLVLLDFRPEYAASSTVLAEQLQQTQPDLNLMAVGATGTGQVEGVVMALRAGLRDVLVEPRRAALIAGFDAARDAALAANAMGAGISGAGPSVFAWFEDADQAHAAAGPVRAAFAAAGFDSEAWVSPLDAAGARLC